MDDLYPPYKILFVCLGNICRSPAAEGVLKRIVEEKGDAANWVIDSAGMGSWHLGSLPDRRMRVHARERGLELDHRCRQVCADDFREFDLIIGMDHSNLSDLHDVCPDPELAHKIVPMAGFFNPDNRWDHVPDPYYEGSEGFELVLDLLEEGCENLYNKIKRK